MITKPYPGLSNEDLRGELFEVVNEWQDNVEGVATEQERLELVDHLFEYLMGNI